MGSLVSVSVILELPAQLAHFLPHGFIQVAIIDRHIRQGADICHPCLTCRIQGTGTGCGHIARQQGDTADGTKSNP